MSVVSLLAHVQMRSHDAVCRVVNAKTCSAKLVGNSVIASRLAHQKFGFDTGKGGLEGPNILAERGNVRVELQRAVVANIVS